ncbi:aldo/keto reductase family oxidoreductase (macronuclear) [Tetrahymena thermophila SB210]|uniref:Aldo/keto reductase family oxidoreductase n=1 Tax=Tetrahymena thermophila (strain SB210) TaxID=312017 RepID=I7M894_TETTS|nr:aldo/keto reductase family oxidoreductase [Tetrahymena thermophila SB210]EAR97418.1 aldo/keto reductase family oxidoreductase [Tetrahymena thermophila SB210]|eukprot:XP_001017663.1 aldo/keto reductase family oxidoreductase [Tetrahymena thermophila SB210]
MDQEKKIINQDIKYVQLNNGYKMPLLGLGTQPYDIVTRVTVEEMTTLLSNALDFGYRNFDTAKQYRNEVEIGQAFQNIFQQGKYKREDVFITTKLFPFKIEKKIKEVVQNSLDQLQTSYIDLYLIQWSFTPVLTNFDGSVAVNHRPIHEVWRELEECVELGMIRSIGVANFNCQMVLDLLSYAKIKPVVNQIEVTPYLPQIDLINFLKRCKIETVAISPLGRAGCFENTPEGMKIKLLEEDIFKQIAQKHKKSVVQVILRCLVQREIMMIPKTAKLDRLKENSEIFDFELTEEDMKQIYSLENGTRAINLKHSQWFGYVPIFD